MWIELHAAMPPETVVAAKPPWNQPEVRPLALRRSPTFLLGKVIATWAEPRGLQPSPKGRGSPTSEPPPVLPLELLPAKVTFWNPGWPVIWLMPGALTTVLLAKVGVLSGASTP